MTTTTIDTTSAPRPAFARRLAAVLEQARVRRANRSVLARHIEAYPSARSAAMVVLPFAR